MDPDAVPLPPEDRAILELESASIAGHTCKVIRLGPGAPGLAAIRQRVAERIPAVPRLSARLGGTEDAPAWVPYAGFDPSSRVVGFTESELLGPDAVAGVAARLFEQRLDRDRPLWQIHLVPVEGGGAALIWRIHHALADGTAAMRFARELLWDRTDQGSEAPLGRSGPGSGQEPGPAMDHTSDDARRRRHLAGLIEREFGESLRRSPFDGRIGTRRRIAFASVGLKPLHDAAKELAGATLNDAVLSVVAGSLRRWIEHHHGSLGAVRVRVPVSLHHEGDAAANLDSFFSLPIALNEPDPVRRLQGVHAATAARKADHDAEELQAALGRLGARSPRLGALLERLEASPRSFALSISNVPGPRERVHVLGAPVESIHSIAEIGERHALRVAVVSLAGELHFGLCADPAIVDDLETMARGIEAEAALLEAAA